MVLQQLKKIDNGHDFERHSHIGQRLLDWFCKCMHRQLMVLQADAGCTRLWIHFKLLVATTSYKALETKAASGSVTHVYTFLAAPSVLTYERLLL